MSPTRMVASPLAKPHTPPSRHPSRHASHKLPVMDMYPEHHAYISARNARIDSDSDEETSWVMLSNDGELVKLPNEKIYYKVRSKIALRLTSVVDAAAAPLAKSDSGIVYITNLRVSPARNHLERRLGEMLNGFNRSYTFQRNQPKSSAPSQPRSWISRTRVSSPAGLAPGPGPPW